MSSPDDDAFDDEDDDLDEDDDEDEPDWDDEDDLDDDDPAFDDGDEIDAEDNRVWRSELHLTEHDLQHGKEADKYEEDRFLPDSSGD